MTLHLPRLLSVFGVIFVAELPDKTALAALVLATRYRPLPVFLGAGIALTLQSALAVAAGGLLAHLPARAVHLTAGGLFLLSAIFMWRRDDDAAPSNNAQDVRPGFVRALTTVFGVMFVAELGDLTQIVTAALAAHYHDGLTVFLGASAALWTVSGLAVFVGHHLGRLFDPSRTRKLAAVVFAVIGCALIAGTI